MTYILGILVIALLISDVLLYIYLRRRNKELLERISILEKGRRDIVETLKTGTEVIKIKEDRDAEKPTVSVNPTDADVLHKLRNETDSRR